MLWREAKVRKKGKIRDSREKYIFQILKTLFGKTFFVKTTTSLIAMKPHEQIAARRELYMKIGMPHIFDIFPHNNFSHYLTYIIYSLLNIQFKENHWGIYYRTIDFLNRHVPHLCTMTLKDFDDLNIDGKKTYINEIINEIKSNKFRF